jgi:hypothetical protein
MYSLSISTRQAYGVYSCWVMALRNAWLAFFNTVTKIELSLATLLGNTNLDSPNMIIDQIHKRIELSLQHFTQKYLGYHYLYFSRGGHGIMYLAWA